MNKIENFEKLPYEKLPNGNGEEVITSEKTFENGVKGVWKDVDFDGPRDGSGNYEVLNFSPESETTDKTVYFAGFTSRAGMYPESLAEFSKEADTHLTTLDRLSGLEIGPIRYPQEEHIPETQLSKILAIQQILDHEKLEETDVIAHSEGSIHAITSAFLFPDRFKNILLMNPAGIIPMSPIELALSGAQEGKVRAIENRTEKEDLSWSRVKELMRNALMLYRSVNSISDVSEEGLMMEMIKEIRSRGVKVGVLYTDRDKLFPKDKLENAITNNGEYEMEDMFDHIQLETGDHGDMLKPHEMKEIVANAFNSLKETGGDDTQDITA